MRLRDSHSLANKPILYQGMGITSGKIISVEVSRKESQYGIVFSVPSDNGNSKIAIPARAEYVVNTLRNVVLGIGSTRICLVEHFLAAAALWGLQDLLISVDGPEMPFGDGSAQFWIDLFTAAGWPKLGLDAKITLAEPIILTRNDSTLLALPAAEFSLVYLMDWDHPHLGKRWQTWSNSQSVDDIAPARTFGWQKEHELLGITENVVSLTTEGFSRPLHWPDEPVRHKLLDLLGDLALAGVNPLLWKAKFISIKGGHELDVAMAKQLQKIIS